MSIHIVQIGKTRFVCGLFWQSLSRPRDLWKEAAQLALKIDADLMVLRKDHAMAQAGYVHTKEGARRGQQSLAAVISKTLAIEGAHYDGHQQPVHNWLCALKLPDGKWAYCAARDANFLPNGDFAGSRDDVLERLQGDYALGGWNVVIGEPELEQLGFHNFSSRTLDTLLPKRKDGQLHVHAWSALRPVRRTVPVKLVSVGAAMALLIAGATTWLVHQHRQQAQQERDLAMQQVRERLSAEAARAIKVMPQPWLVRALPIELARVCVARLDPLTPGGWQLELMQCDASQASYSWARNGANIDYLRSGVPTAHIALSGNQATLVVPLARVSNNPEKLLDAEVVLRSLLARSQAAGVTLKLAPQMLPPARPQAPIKGAKAVVLPPPAWKTWTLGADLGALSPLAAAELISLAGVRLERITWRSGRWSIEGVVYAK